MAAGSFCNENRFTQFFKIGWPISPILCLPYKTLQGPISAPVHAQLSLSTFGCEWLHSYCQWVALLVPPIHDFVCLGVISACWPIQRALFMQAQNWPQSCRSARPVPPLNFWLFLAGLPVATFFTDGPTNSPFLRRIKVRSSKETPD